MGWLVAAGTTPYLRPARLAYRGGGTLFRAASPRVNTDRAPKQHLSQAFCYILLPARGATAHPMPATSRPTHAHIRTVQVSVFSSVPFRETRPRGGHGLVRGSSQMFPLVSRYHYAAGSTGSTAAGGLADVVVCQLLISASSSTNLRREFAHLPLQWLLSRSRARRVMQVVLLHRGRRILYARLHLQTSCASRCATSTALPIASRIQSL